jgi:type II secretory pathway pseudopilin PulG
MAGATERRRSVGFTIFEVAVALFLLALLFGSVFLPLRSQVDARKIEETTRLLDKAREALLGYAITHGYFPCPADETSAGREAANADRATGVCSIYHGLLPAATLGFSEVDAQGYALDAWGTSANRIRYAVASHGAGPAVNSRAFTRTNGMRTAGIAVLGDPALSLLHVCTSGSGVVPATNCGSAATMVSTAPVVVWSVGGNAASGGTSVHEAQNPNPNGGSSDRLFVSRVRSSTPPNEFDDIVTWIPMSVLIHRMVAAGQLP